MKKIIHFSVRKKLRTLPLRLHYFWIVIWLVIFCSNLINARNFYESVVKLTNQLEGSKPRLENNTGQDSASVRSSTVSDIRKILENYVSHLSKLPDFRQSISKPIKQVIFSLENKQQNYNVASQAASFASIDSENSTKNILESIGNNNSSNGNDEKQQEMPIISTGLSNSTIDLSNSNQTIEIESHNERNFSNYDQSIAGANVTKPMVKNSDEDHPVIITYQPVIVSTSKFFNANSTTEATMGNTTTITTMKMPTTDAPSPRNLKNKKLSLFLEKFSENLRKNSSNDPNANLETTPTTTTTPGEAVVPSKRELNSTIELVIVARNETASTQLANGDRTDSSSSLVNKTLANFQILVSAKPEANKSEETTAIDEIGSDSSTMAPLTTPSPTTVLVLEKSNGQQSKDLIKPVENAVDEQDKNDANNRENLPANDENISSADNDDDDDHHNGDDKDDDNDDDDNDDDGDDSGEVNPESDNSIELTTAESVSNSRAEVYENGFGDEDGEERKPVVVSGNMGGPHGSHMDKYLENLEAQFADMMRNKSDLLFRAHHAMAVRNQKFHGVPQPVIIETNPAKTLYFDDHLHHIGVGGDRSHNYHYNDDHRSSPPIVNHQALLYPESNLFLNMTAESMAKKSSLLNDTKLIEELKRTNDLLNDQIEKLKSFDANVATEKYFDFIENETNFPKLETVTESFNDLTTAMDLQPFMLDGDTKSYEQNAKNKAESFPQFQNDFSSSPITVPSIIGEPLMDTTTERAFFETSTLGNGLNFFENGFNDNDNRIDHKAQSMTPLHQVSPLISPPTASTHSESIKQIDAKAAFGLRLMTKNIDQPPDHSLNLKSLKGQLKIDSNFESLLRSLKSKNPVLANTSPGQSPEKNQTTTQLLNDPTPNVVKISAKQETNSRSTDSITNATTMLISTTMTTQTPLMLGFVHQEGLRSKSVNPITITTTTIKPSLDLKINLDESPDENPKISNETATVNDLKNLTSIVFYEDEETGLAENLSDGMEDNKIIEDRNQSASNNINTRVLKLPSITIIHKIFDGKNFTTVQENRGFGSKLEMPGNRISKEDAGYKEWLLKHSEALQSLLPAAFKSYRSTSSALRDKKTNSVGEIYLLPNITDPSGQLKNIDKYIRLDSVDIEKFLKNEKIVTKNLVEAPLLLSGSRSRSTVAKRITNKHHRPRKLSYKRAKNKFNDYLSVADLEAKQQSKKIVHWFTPHIENILKVYRPRFIHRKRYRKIRIPNRHLMNQNSKKQSSKTKVQDNPVKLSEKDLDKSLVKVPSASTRSSSNILPQLGVQNEREQHESVQSFWKLNQNLTLTSQKNVVSKVQKLNSNQNVSQLLATTKFDDEDTKKFKIFCAYEAHPSMQLPMMDEDAGNGSRGRFFDINQLEKNSPMLTMCTHLVYSFVNVDLNGDIVVGLSNINDETLRLQNEQNNQANLLRFVRLKKRYPHLRMLLAVGGWNTSPQLFSLLMTIGRMRERLALNIHQFLLNYGFDGVVVAWFYPIYGKKTNLQDQSPIDVTKGSRQSRSTMQVLSQVDDKQNLVKFVRKLRKTFDTSAHSANLPTFQKRLEIGIMAPPFEKLIDNGYDVEKLTKLIDHFIVMAYDFYGPWQDKVHHFAPLYGSKLPGSSEADQKLNINHTLNYWIDQKQAPAEKTLLGLAFYGRSFTLANQSQADTGSASIGPGLAGPVTNQPGFLSFNELCELYLDSPNVRLREDDFRITASLQLNDQWIGFDDELSLYLKTKYAIGNRLSGVFVWSINYDDYRNRCGWGMFPLLKAINKAIEHCSVWKRCSPTVNRQSLNFS